MPGEATDALGAAAEPFSDALAHLQRGVLELITAARLGLDAIEAVLNDMGAAAPGRDEEERAAAGTPDAQRAQPGPRTGARVERIRLS
jgi:hypothetical protein